MSQLQNNEWQREQQHISELNEIINQKEEILSKNTNKVSTDVVELKTTFWNDVTVNMDEPDDVAETYSSIKQQAQLLSERERTRGQIERQLKILDRLKSSPFFGRIDFVEDGEKVVDKIYIGTSSLMDIKEENFLIFDWRAPIASMYYDFAPGPAQYNTPSGIFNGVMELKRQYIIRNTELKAMFDTGVTIGDEMLQEVLGNQADTQMKSIVATIQKEQNLIIRNEKAQLLVVQGVAGSGKTSAALQRVAYLLYRYRGTINAENIMLFSPNTLFNSYVATVLPELGEENMKQTTFQEYLDSRIDRDFFVEDAFDQMEYLLTAENDEEYHTRVEGIQYKASIHFQKHLENYVIGLSEHGMIFQDIIFRKKVLISKQEIYDYFYNLDISISIPNKIELVKRWLFKELKRWMKKEQAESWVQEEAQFLEKDDYLEAYNELQSKEYFSENSFDDYDREEQYLAEKVVKKHFKRLFNSVKKFKFVNMRALYKQCLQEDVKLKNWQEIRNFTIQSLKNRIMNYEDATPFVYLQDLIIGRVSDTSIRHVFIDEAQDYTPFQFSFIKQLFPFSKMTLLGDINQAIYSGLTNSQTVLSESIPQTEVERIVLTKTYRSTKQIVEFTKGLIENGDQIEPFNRNGQKPSLTTLLDYQELENRVIKKLKELKKNGHQTVAIICKTARESKVAYDLLKHEIPVRLIEKGTINYEEGTLIIPSYLAKGIEFDAVIIYNAAKYDRPEDRKLFYTACTRAMHELHLFSVENKSPLMECINEETYEFFNE